MTRCELFFKFVVIYFDFFGQVDFCGRWMVFQQVLGYVLLHRDVFDHWDKTESGLGVMRGR